MFEHIRAVRTNRSGQTEDSRGTRPLRSPKRGSETRSLGWT